MMKQGGDGLQIELLESCSKHISWNVEKVVNQWFMHWVFTFNFAEKQKKQGSRGTIKDNKRLLYSAFLGWEITQCALHQIITQTDSQETMLLHFQLPRDAGG